MEGRQSYTGRDKVIKLQGNYHGHADFLLVQAGSGVATLGIPGSPGVPESIARHTLSLPYNDMECLKAVMEKQGDSVACIIVEPIAGNMGLVPPKKDFLETLRALADQYGIDKIPAVVALTAGERPVDELEGVDEATASRAMELAAAKLPIKTRFVVRERQLG